MKSRYGKKQLTLQEQLKHFLLEHDSAGVDLCEHVAFLEKQLETARVDAIATFGCELINEHENLFPGGEIQIGNICRVVNESFAKVSS